MSFTYYNISTTDKTTLSTVEQVPPKSITLCNRDVSGDSCTVSLYILSKVGTSIVDSGTNSNETDNYTTTSSVTLTVDGTTALASIFKGEKVWKSDGTLFGTCTSVDSGTQLTFSGGIEQTLADNANLYIGTRYHILHKVIIPAGHTLVLEEPELNYDPTIYSLEFVLSAAGAGEAIDIKVTH